jgi:hypothetical protein
MEPKTTQYGSHMVMTNVSKQSKTKFINIDTRFRDEYNYLSTANYNITLPQRISDVSTMTLMSIEIPMSFYNISAAIGNNCFTISVLTKSSNTTVNTTITVPDGNYTISNLTSYLSGLSAITSKNITFNVASNGYSSTIKLTNSSSTTTTTIQFAVGSSGSNDKYNIKSKLGWILGFRQPSYVLTTDTTTSESFIDLNGSRYLYLAVDEFNKGNQYSFVSPLYNSLINKSIIARISMTKDTHGFGSVLVANLTNGLLVADLRSYTGQIDLLKMNVQLLDEYGQLVNLNGLDFSFCLAVEHI